MERAGGWYKRSTQLWLGIVGFTLALMLNVDAFSIAEALWRDPTLRQSVTDQAQKYKLSSTSDGMPISNPDDAAQALRELNSQISQDLQLPVGWHTEVYALQAGEACTWVPQRSGDIWGISSKGGCILIKDDTPNRDTGLFGKFMGLVLTAVAVSQGALFWFDLLSKLGNLRSSGIAPTTSREKRMEKLKIKTEVTHLTQY